MKALPHIPCKRRNLLRALALSLFGLQCVLPLPAHALDSAAMTDEAISAPRLCTPPAGGDTCDQGDAPASLGAVGNGGVSLGAGNPINLATGNKYQREVDMPALPGILGLEIVRHYNSAYSRAQSRPGIPGHGWKLSYETSLHITPERVQILQADGSRILFTRNAEAAQHPHKAAPASQREHCTTNDPAHGTLSIERLSAGEQYRWVWPSGRTLSFDAAGRLTQILAPSGEFLHLYYDPSGALIKVTDPQGRSLQLGYRNPRLAGQQTAPLLTHIDGPGGRFEYAHEPLRTHPGAHATSEPRHYRLSAVRYPSVTPAPADADSAQPVYRRYHYEDPRHPAHLTGISLAGSGSDGVRVDERIATYAYDEQGRAVVSMRGTAAQPQLHIQLSYEARATAAGDGITVLTDRRGQQTRYRFRLIAGQYRLTESTGPGCASCPPGNRRHAYDSAGRLIAETRIEHLAARPAQGRTTTPDPHMHRSAVLSTTHYRRDALGRIIRLEHSEHPQADSASASSKRLKARAVHRPTAEAPTPPPPQNPTLRLVQSARYDDPRWPFRPTTLERPSVVSGKLHRVQLRYNDAGQVVEVHETGFSPISPAGERTSTPIERRTRLSYQRINGRSVLVTIDGPLPNGPAGTPADSDIRTLNWDTSGSFIVGHTAAGGSQSTFNYLPHSGLISAVSKHAGEHSRFAYDARLQLVQVWRHHPGWATAQLEHFRHDAQGRQTESLRVDADSGAVRPQQRRAYDALGQLRWQASANGVLHTWTYDSEGRLITQRRLSPGMELVSAPHPQPSGPVSRPGHSQGASAIDTVYDDFGRHVATFGATTGTTIRRFDEADRLIGMTDARGNISHYSYDNTDRIRRQRVTDIDTSQESVSEWHYAAGKLVKLEHPTQDERYQYNAQGLRSARIVTIRTSTGSFTAVTRFEYNDAGQLIASTLPDGSRLSYTRDTHGQVVALSRNPLRTPWLRGLMPEERIASDFERDLVGVTRFVNGNGIEAWYQRSRDGLLARTRYRPKPRAQAPGQTDHDRHPSAGVPVIFEQLLGIRRAYAQRTPSSVAGALAAPPDPGALLDIRYLWDRHGNLIQTRQHTPTHAHWTLDSHAYDQQSHLVASVRSHLLTDTRAPDTPHPPPEEAAVWRYHYDNTQRRRLAQEGASGQHELHAQTEHSAFVPGSYRQRGQHYTASGQPLQHNAHALRWDARGRLTSLHPADGPAIHYRYDHRGLRNSKTVGTVSTHYLHDTQHNLLAELNPSAQLTRQYIYLSDLPLAVLDTPEGSRLAAETTAIADIIDDLKTVLARWLGMRSPLNWVHTNHLGAPEAATNAQGQLVWQARYAPFGRAEPVEHGLRLNLRLPGQYADAESGLHYNRQRYYDPDRGQYLSPDPLGTPDGPNNYAYARFNPLRYIDPDGLILFAFDGTGNTEASQTNVHWFREAYNDNDPGGVGDASRPFYVAGPGTDWWALGDSGLAYTLKSRVNEQLINLDNYVRAKLRAETAAEGDEYAQSNPLIIPVDIIGFSRGAAAARDFANVVIARKNEGYFRRLVGGACVGIEIRFMGLFDTVLSTQVNGILDLSVSPSQIRHVAHAVAVNEHRALFPLESIETGYEDRGFDPTRIERSFIGAHSDIGGGYVVSDGGDLSDIALNWMHAQAVAAGVPMRALEEDQTMIASPILHDESVVLPWILPPFGGLQDDREVRFPDQSLRARVTDFESMTYTAAEAFITRGDPRPPSPAPSDTDFLSGPLITNRAGIVDLQLYGAWLSANYNQTLN